MCGVVKNKNPIPQNHFLLGQEKILPAVPPGLALLRPLYAYDNMQTLITVCPAVSPTAVFPRVRFALESPFAVAPVPHSHPERLSVSEHSTVTLLSQRFEESIPQSAPFVKDFNKICFFNAPET